MKSTVIQLTLCVILFFVSYEIRLTDYDSFIISLAIIYFLFFFIISLFTLFTNLFQVIKKKENYNWLYILALPICFLSYLLGGYKIDSVYNSNKRNAELLINEIRKFRSPEGYPSDISILYGKLNIEEYIGILRKSKIQYSTFDNQFRLEYPDQNGTYYRYNSENASWTSEPISL